MRTKALLLAFLFLSPALVFGGERDLAPTHQFYDPYGQGRKLKLRENGRRLSCRELFAAVKVPEAELRKDYARVLPPRTRTTEEFLAKYKEAHGGFNYFTSSAQNNSPDQYLRFIRPDDYAESPAWVHGVEVYGVDNYIAWAKADEYLKSIPKGEFEPSLKVVQKVNELSTHSAHKGLRKLDHILPNGYLPTKPGALKHRDSFGAGPLRHPLTEAQYETLKHNPWLKGFIELPPPLSGPGKRRGWIQYGGAEDIRSKMAELTAWYKANKDTMDPVELAARYQYALVSIHPFTDGNGRTSRLVMDRILAEHGIPAPVLRDSSNDILVPVNEYIDQVREGLDRTLMLGERAVFSPAPRNDADGGLEIAEIIRSRFPTVEAMKKMQGEFAFGGKRFELSLIDGLLYDADGIPYTMHDGALYPISDRAYRLMEMNVPISFKTVKHHEPGQVIKSANGAPDYVTPARDWEETVIVTGTSPDQIKYFQNNAQMLQDVSEGKLAAKDVKVMPYDAIDQANRDRKIFLYPWQESLFERAAKIDAQEPDKMLMPFRKGKTTFDTTAGNSKKAALVLAQYEMVDMYYADLERTAKELFPQQVKQVKESRKKIHDAAVTLMEPYRLGLKALSPEARKIVEESPEAKIFNSYLNVSKLRFPSFEEAMRKTNDDYVYLLRSDSSVVNKIGFLSHSQIAAAFDALPLSHKLRALVEKLNAFLQTPEGQKRIKAMMKIIRKKSANKDGLYKYLPAGIHAIIADLEKYYNNVSQLVSYATETLFKNKYDMHSAGPEFERAFVMDLAHAGGGGLKDSKSFTTNAEMMAGVPYGEDVTDLWPAQVSLVKIPRKNAHIQFGSDSYTNEYEILANKPVGPWRIKQKFSKEELEKGKLPNYVADPKAFQPTPAQREAALFLQNFYGSNMYDWLTN